MKKFLKTFDVPKDGKVPDKTFTYNMVAGVLGILLCLTSLSAATWAWFGGSVTTENNTIQSGQYGVTENIIVKTTDGDQEVPPDEYGVYNLGKGTYHITLTGTGTVSTGYCIVTLKQQSGTDTQSDTGANATQKHTQQVFTSEYMNNATEADKAGKVSSISFDLLIGEENNNSTVQMTIEPCWGTSSVPNTEKIVDGCKCTFDGTQLTIAYDTTNTENSDQTNQEEPSEQQ
ncbi:MAG: hypothetical protein IJ011_08890 [Clostridia bacterium]|nr:hypothetical protein [Clostridia bacterium]